MRPRRGHCRDSAQAAGASLIGQLADSSRVSMYVEHLRTASLSPQAADPSDGWFNPIKAAIIRHREGDMDEAFWLIFLLTHFGRTPPGRVAVRTRGLRRLRHGRTMELGAGVG